MNHTPATVVPTPERSAYLNWVDDGNPATKEDIIGPAIALKVEKGDQLNLEVWAKFERQVSYNRNATVAMMSTLLGGSFVNAGFGLETAAKANLSFTNSLGGALAGTGSDPATRPYAYLNYIVFDLNYQMQDAGAMRLSIPAGNRSQKTMCRVDVDNPSTLNLRIPSGNEVVANVFFTPGGFTL